MSCGIILSLFLPNELNAMWKWFEVHKYMSSPQPNTRHAIGQGRVTMRQIWEGSAIDSRVFENALVRPQGLKIPHGM
ncbi:hypothetical protein RHMOL_Rhmol10G0196100 [Rhododendron molle]|uniref:Uncharacterized protein n=1 Tax=Rhododendron molle TaxID=49168 RepID=A0ACC0M582_RHOML|nr:hypothetical protein RHMOL_Rhmol10G0196100 [Rhododendron molle]